MNHSNLHFFDRFVRYVSLAFFGLIVFSGCSPSTEPTPNDKGGTPIISQTATPSTAKPGNPLAVLTTTKGEVTIELYTDKAPVTVANFIDYAKSGFYNGTVFHRVIKDFMIQGGGFDTNMTQKTTNAPIQNEASPALKNLRGTISMARTADPHSAASQFFISVNDNYSLDKSPHNPGYAVFGRVIKGMEVVDAISLVKTGSFQYMQDVPSEQVILTSVDIKP